jgi:hypothetical protein
MIVGIGIQFFFDDVQAAVAALAHINNPFE